MHDQKLQYGFPTYACDLLIARSCMSHLSIMLQRFDPSRSMLLMKMVLQKSLVQQTETSKLQVYLAFGESVGSLGLLRLLGPRVLKGVSTYEQKWNVFVLTCITSRLNMWHPLRPKFIHRANPNYVRTSWLPGATLSNFGWRIFLTFVIFGMY